jgi:hypothetical protein
MRRKGWKPVLVEYDDMQRIFNGEANALAYAKRMSSECSKVVVSVNTIVIARWINGKLDNHFAS